MLGVLKRSVLAGLCLVAFPAGVALADEPTPVPQPSASASNAVGACLDAGQVWLVVVDEAGTVRANQCVGTPESGEAALWAAGMRTQKTRSGLICAIDGHPERCPDRFEGQYWNYLHAEPGKAWTRSNEGANSRTPAAGSIEGWCYNTADAKDCEPPVLRIVSAGQDVSAPGVESQDLTPVVHPPVPPVEVPWIWIGAGGVAVAVVAGVLIARRRPPRHHEGTWR